jgi:hypothetical protein
MRLSSAALVEERLSLSQVRLSDSEELPHKWLEGCLPVPVCPAAYLRLKEGSGALLMRE